MDTVTGPSSQVRAIDPYIHTLSAGLEKIHPVVFSSMAHKGHRVCAVEGQTATKFMIKTECINNEANSRRHHCRGTGTMQFVLGKDAPALFVAKLNHDKGCNFSTVTLEDIACEDKTFATNYCEYLSEAIEFSSADATAKREARKEVLKVAEEKGYDVPCTDFASINAGNLNTQIIALYEQMINHFSVRQPKSFWKF